jgi:hypothetical protein
MYVKEAIEYVDFLTNISNTGSTFQVQILTFKASAFGSSDPDPELDLFKKIPDMGDTDPKFLANTVHL